MTIRDGFVSRSKQNPSSRSRKGASQETRSVEEGGQDTVSRHLARACAQCDQHVYFCNLISYFYIYGVSVYIYIEREREAWFLKIHAFHGNHAVGRICISSGLPNGFHHERKARFHALCAGAERAGDDSHRDQEPAPILERSVGRWTKPVPPVTFKWLWRVWPDWLEGSVWFGCAGIPEVERAPQVI